MIPMAVCEIVDRCAILTVKQELFEAPDKIASVSQQREPLVEEVDKLIRQYPAMFPLVNQLYRIHHNQWRLEGLLTEQLQESDTRQDEIVETIINIRESNKARIEAKNAISELVNETAVELREKY